MRGHALSARVVADIDPAVDCPSQGGHHPRRWLAGRVASLQRSVQSFDRRDRYTGFSQN
jgi:hypothetical protein